MMDSTLEQVTSPESFCEGMVSPEQTLRRNPSDSVSHAEGSDECCLVQMYPPDIVDGMCLLEEELFTIGRSDESNLPLIDSSVSRYHAELRQKGDGYVVCDLNSTNGTLVNGVAITGEHCLTTGDTIQIGSFLFRYISEGSVETQYYEAVYSALTRDALTGAMNKRFLLDALSREIPRCVRAKMELTVVMLDIDHFKSVNDTHGHLVGDEVLREFGRRVMSVSREDDLLARYGGEEFCYLLAATGRDEAIEMAERCRKTIAESPFETEAGPLEITASFGFACLDPANPSESTELLEKADQQLYEAKRGGRNRVCG